MGPDGLHYTLDNNSTRIFREKIRGGITMLRSEGFPVFIMRGKVLGNRVIYIIIKRDYYLYSVIEIDIGLMES